MAEIGWKSSPVVTTSCGLAPTKNPTSQTTRGMMVTRLPLLAWAQMKITDFTERIAIGNPTSGLKPYAWDTAWLLRPVTILILWNYWQKKYANNSPLSILTRTWPTQKQSWNFSRPSRAGLGMLLNSTVKITFLAWLMASSVSLVTSACQSLRAWAAR